VVAFLVVFTLLNLFMFTIEKGTGFGPDMNYWYWNVDKDSQDYGMECEGTWGFFRR
jgi:hypothetical protein